MIENTQGRVMQRKIKWPNFWALFCIELVCSLHLETHAVLVAPTRSTLSSTSYTKVVQKGASVQRTLVPAMDTQTSESYLAASTAKHTSGNDTHFDFHDGNSTVKGTGELSENDPDTHVHLHLSQEAESYIVSLEDCVTNNFTITGREGVIKGFVRRNKHTAMSTQCQWTLQVPEKHFVILVLDTLDFQKTCHSLFKITILPSRYTLTCEKANDRSPLIFFRTNTVLFRFTNHSDSYISSDTLPSYRIHFQSSTEKLWSKMAVDLLSPTQGYIRSPGFDSGRSHGPFLNASYTVTVPEGAMLMVSFPYFDTVIGVGVVFIVSTDSQSTETRHFYENALFLSTRLFFSRTLMLWMKCEDHYTTRQEEGAGIKVFFSLHPGSQAPQQLQGGLFNCSVAHYPSFHKHLHCNMQLECQAGEDENDRCPFSSGRCPETVDAGSRCFYMVYSVEALSWISAQRDCQKKGGDLAMMKTEEEWEAFWTVLKYARSWECAYIGLLHSQSMSSFMYTDSWFWADKTVALDVHVRHRIQSKLLTLGMDLHATAEGKTLTWAFPGELKCMRYVCQLTSMFPTIEPSSVPFLNLKTNASSQTEGLSQLLLCPEGHWVNRHSGWCCPIKPNAQLSCKYSPKKVASTSTALSSPDGSVQEFVCEDSGTLPYTLVCDFREDCADGSDESFCKLSICALTEFQCGNGQCILFSGVHDHKKDCLDGSDVQSGWLGLFHDIFHPRLSGPKLIDLTAQGELRAVAMTASQQCPETHIRCLRTDHCLPIYLLCNGVNDCPDLEDELFCDRYFCSGFYRCRQSLVCVHMLHLCDGITHCPLHDDEMLCDVSCPEHCQCAGLSFVCPQFFLAAIFPGLRYLDASFSKMSLEDLTASVGLVFLRLAWCDLAKVSQITLPNLQFLDLSHNALASLDMDLFISFKQLKTLILKGNPLAVLEGGNTNDYQRKLSVVELSHTELSLLSSAVFKPFISLHSLNVSFSKVSTVTEEGFQFVPNLQGLDLRGNDIKNYPQTIFKSLTNVKMIYADDYKLCCPGMFAEGIEEGLCIAPKDELSSCEDLLFSDLYRSFLWFMGIASLLGNIGCFCFRNFILKSRHASGFNIFVSNLSVADCLMGVYLVTIGMADEIYRGSYYLYENVWLFSVPCSVSGVLSLLSSEVSALTIWFITLDRFLVLRFPFSAVRFTRKSAFMTCALIWVGGLSLSLTPILIPHWKFYSQTGICIPLPITKQDFEGQDYSFGVMIVLNFILLLLIAVGQVVIYHSVVSNTLSVGTSKKQKDVTIARRLISVAVSDFLCWFPIGLLGLLSSAGVPVPAEVNVTMSIFVLPLNSALNPFLYTFNMLAERRRKENEARILKHLESVLEAQPAAAATANAAASTGNADAAADADAAGHPPSSQQDVGHQQGSKDGTDDVMQDLHEALTSDRISFDQVRTFLLSLQGKEN